MADQPQPVPNQLNIEISEEVAEGHYANLAIITHSHSEFVIDFVNVMPGTPKSKVKSRVILTPQHAREIDESIDREYRQVRNCKWRDQGHRRSSNTFQLRRAGGAGVRGDSRLVDSR